MTARWELAVTEGGSDNRGVSIPLEPVRVPDRVRALARGARLDAVWENELGGVTFRTDDGRHIKHGPRNAETSFAGEARAARMGRAAHRGAAA